MSPTEGDFVQQFDPHNGLSVEIVERANLCQTGNNVSGAAIES